MPEPSTSAEKNPAHSTRYREATADPAAQLVCQRYGALVAATATDLHETAST